MTLLEAIHLVEAAQQKRIADPRYRPTGDELKAVDVVLIEQAKERIGAATQVERKNTAA